MKIDCSGLACPEPVLQTKKALESLPNDSILEVIVDNVAARENVVRFAQNGGFETRLESLADGKTLVSIIKGFACQIVPETNDETFLDKTFGKGCKVSEWGNPNAKLTENDSNAFFIESLNSTNDNPFGDCQFSLTSKYRTFYSPRLKTIVFWSLTQEPQFTYKEINYDEEMLNSFNFTK